MRGLRAWAYGAPPKPAPSQRRLGLALGGGFARGIAHIGVLKVLEEQKIPIHCIAGTSVGALMASAYACGTPLRQLEELAAATRFKDFGKWTLSWMGLASNEPLADFFHRFCAVRDFEQLRIPLAIAATDLASGELVFFTRGELGPPLRASCAYPGLFLPVEYDGRMLVDGFLGAPVPVDALPAMGADIRVAVYLASDLPPDKPKTMADVIGRSFSIMQANAEKVWRQKAHLVIEPDVTGFQWDDFKRAPELIAAGEKAARDAVPRLRALLSPAAGLPAGERHAPARLPEVLP